MNLRFELEKMLIKESIEDKGILKSCFMAGTPGAGKSYTISKVKSGQVDPRIVNTDKFTEFISSSLGVSASEMGNYWKNYGGKIKLLGLNQLVLYINSLLPLWIDGTSSSPNSLFKRQGILKSIGYDTAMIWVETSLDTAIERNRQRDRTVPEDFLRSTYEKIQELKSYYKSEFRYFFEVRNDEGELNNEAITQAYRKVDSFFNSPLDNPIGSRLVSDMRENGHKYLVDTDEYSMAQLKKLVASWYK